MVLLSTKYYSGGQLEKNEMGGACSIMVKRRGAYRVSVGRSERKRPRRRRIILRWIFRKWDGGAWTGLI